MPEETCPDRTAHPLEEKRVGSVSVIAAADAAEWDRPGDIESPKPATVSIDDELGDVEIGPACVLGDTECTSCQ